VYDFQHFQGLSKFNNPFSKHSKLFGLVKRYIHGGGFRNDKILEKLSELRRYEMVPSSLFPCMSFYSVTHTTAPKISLIRLDLHNPQITISVSMSST